MDYDMGLQHGLKCIELLMGDQDVDSLTVNRAALQRTKSLVHHWSTSHSKPLSLRVLIYK